jgi:hypothetical protein
MNTKLKLVLLASACSGCIVLSAPGARADSVTPVSGSMSLQAFGSNCSQASTPCGTTDSNGNTVTPVSQFNTTQWSGTPTTLTNAASVTTPDNLLTVSGSGSATWTNADTGTVSFSNYGWTTPSNPSFGGLAVYNGTAALNYGGTANFFTTPAAADWQYTFAANVDGTFTMTYDVTSTASNVVTPGTFGLGGWNIYVDGSTSTGDFLYNAFDPDANGVFSLSLIAGDTYTIALENEANVNGAMSTASMDGTFDWDISPSIAATPLPAALPLFATGLSAMGFFGWRKRRKQILA